MLNNKGQSLVLFVLILPVLLMILLMVVDIGKMVLLKQELDDINYIALDYSIEKMDELEIKQSIKEIINKNRKDIDTIDIKIENNKIAILLEDNIDGSLSLLDNIKLFRVKSSYVGYINEENKKVIERDK